MVTYNTVFADKQYRAIAKKAAGYFLENTIMSALPTIYTDVPDAIEYRHVPLSQSFASQGVGDDWSPQGPKAETEHGYTDFKLTGREMHLLIPKKEINHYTDRNLLADKRNQEIEQWVKDVDGQLIYGNYRDQRDRDGLLDDGGYITQATSVIDLNGADSNLATKGYIWKALVKMIDSIPLRYRQHTPPMTVFASENLVKRMDEPDRIYQDQVEGDFIRRVLMGKDAAKARKIGQIITTDEILISGTDTKGTHDRICLFVPDARVLANVVSRSFSLLDEEKIMFNMHQAWGFRGACCIFDGNGALFSEQIVWA